MSEARHAYDSLDRPWRVAFDEAWASWCGGSAGVGAVISDVDGTIVSVGRNRALEVRTEPGVLASTSIAHGEMNALALLPIGPTAGFTITTTFEPCLMCAATIVQADIPAVRYAAADPHFDGLHDWFSELPFDRYELPQRTELGGPLGAFAHVLHLSWMCFWAASSTDAHRDRCPEHLALATEIAHDGLLAGAAQDGDLLAALEALWPRLVKLAESG